MTETTRRKGLDQRRGGAGAADIRAVLDRTRAMLQARLDTLDLEAAVGAAEVRAMNAELKELNTTQMALAKAEEAYHEKYGKSDDEDAVDYDAVRLAIGRRLDRIRQAKRATEIPEQPEPRGTGRASPSV